MYTVTRHGSFETELIGKYFTYDQATAAVDHDMEALLNSASELGSDAAAYLVQTSFEWQIRESDLVRVAD